jgi:hypothetical protein
MKIYQRRKSQPLKWLLAFILFCLVMGFTMSDVYGITVNQQNPTPSQDQSGSDDTPVTGGGHAPTGEVPPSTVPEPSTLALLALGLGGGALMIRRKKN